MARVIETKSGTFVIIDATVSVSYMCHKKKLDSIHIFQLSVFRPETSIHSERCDHKRSGETPCGRKEPLSTLEAKVSNVPINIPQGFNDVGCRHY